MKVTTTNNSAEYAQVAQFAAISKSGENTPHGSLFWSNYNSFTGARAWQDPVGPSFENFNQFSATSGGPVYIPHLYNGKDKTFYFFTYGGARYRTGARYETSVPTAAFRKATIPPCSVPLPSWTQQRASNLPAISSRPTESARWPKHCRI